LWPGNYPLGPSTNGPAGSRTDGVNLVVTATRPHHLYGIKEGGADRVNRLGLISNFSEEPRAGATESATPLELEAGADPGVDNGNIDGRYRRELNELELAAQKEILRQGPIESAADGDAPEKRIALPRAGR
jgi:hypothetical protein